MKNKKKLYILLCICLVSALLAGCAQETEESAPIPKDESSLPILLIEHEDVSDEPTASETSEATDEDESEPEPLPPLLTGEVWRAPVEWDANEYLSDHCETENGFAMTRMRTPEDVQAFLDACPETAELIAESETASERFASFDETFFASYDLAVLYIGNSGTPRYVVEGERWTNDGEQSVATIQIRCYQPYCVDENYVCWLKLLPLNKAASDACDVLSSRYLYGHISDGHDHEEPIDPTVTGDTPTYPDDLSVTISQDDTLYKTASLTGDYAKQLLGLLETLIYTQENVCACEPEELWGRPIVVDDTYAIYTSDGFVRCDRGQAYLTQEQIKLIDDAERYLSMQYWSFGWLGTVFGCDDLMDDAFFADGNIKLLKTDEDWQAFSARCVPAEVPESHLYFFFNRIKYEPDFFKWYDIAAVLFRAEDATALDAQTAVLAQDGTALLEVRYADWDVPKTESETGYMLALFMVNEYFVPQVTSWQFAVTNKPSEEESIKNTTYEWNFVKGWPVFVFREDDLEQFQLRTWPAVEFSHGSAEWNYVAKAFDGEEILIHADLCVNEKQKAFLQSLGIPYETVASDADCVHLDMSYADAVKLIDLMYEAGLCMEYHPNMFGLCDCDDLNNKTNTVSPKLPEDVDYMG